MKLLIELKGLNFCELVGDTSFGSISRIVSIFKDMLYSSGDLPKKCPIRNGTNIGLDMMNLDPKNFPFVPEMNFKLVLLCTADSVPNALVVNVTGEVVNRRRPRF